jgi:dihydroorotase
VGPGGFGLGRLHMGMTKQPRGSQVGMPLLVHGEATDPSVDFFDREATFIERTARPLLAALPELRLVLEHITTRDAAEFVAEAPPNVAATITPQHILLNRNALFVVRSPWKEKEDRDEGVFIYYFSP